MLSSLDDWSWVAATCNVSSALLVGPMLVLLMRRMGWGHLRVLVVGLIGWAALFAAQIVMWRVFGFQAGYPGFKYVQWMMLPISAGNFLAAMWLTRQGRKPIPASRSEIDTYGRHAVGRNDQLAGAQ